MFNRLLERLVFIVPIGFKSRIKGALYRLLGMKMGERNRFEHGCIRRGVNIEIGDYNCFSRGYQLWPLDEDYVGTRILVGSNNYFNRNLMIEACGKVAIGDNNMFGPDVYLADSNHSFGANISIKNSAMSRGEIKIGNGCWIGAKAIILKDVTLGDNCVVAAGAVVTKSFVGGSVIAGVPAKILYEK